MDQAPENVKPFFNLPVELRSLVYQDILDDIVRPPLHPWDRLPKPKNYLSLLLVNREISAEVSDLFCKLYADKITFYTENIVDLNWIWRNMESWPILKNARLWTRALLEDTDSEGDAEYEGMVMLIDRQPGFKDEWLENPGWMRTESSGFQDLDGKLKYPAMDNGCWITTYRWRSVGPLDDFELAKDDDPFPVDSGSMVLHGRLRDLSWKNVPLKLVQRRMEHERQKREEGREDEPCTKACGCYPSPAVMEDGIPARHDSDLDEAVDYREDGDGGQDVDGGVGRRGW